MKQIDVKKQVRLSLAKCIELVLSGIRFRLFRAAITVTIISLAVTFLMTMLGESIISRKVAAVIDAQTAPRHTFTFWLSYLTEPLTETRLTGALSEVNDKPGSERYEEMKTWGALDDATMKRLTAVAKDQTEYQDYFDRLEAGQRRPLVGGATGEDIFWHLQSPTNYQAFEAELKNAYRQPPNPTHFHEFLADWKNTVPLREKILQGHQRALAELGKDFAGRAGSEVLAAADANFLSHVQKEGFRLSPGELDVLRKEASLAVGSDQVRRLVSVTRMKRRLADRLGMTFADVDPRNLSAEASSSSGGQWVVEQVAELKDRLGQIECDLALGDLIARKPELSSQMRQSPLSEPAASGAKNKFQPRFDEAAWCPILEELKALALKNLQAAGIPAEIAGDVQARCQQAIKAQLLKAEPQKNEKMNPEDASILAAKDTILQFDLTAQRVREVCQYKVTQDSLATVKAVVSQSAGTGGYKGFSSRTLWLIIVSFLVCIVGIANAMLMSVTERFREIATMKCLGATDEFIMINFILESIMQGLAGGVVGVLLGMLLGALRGWGKYGGIALEHFPLADMSWGLLVSLVVGVVVSALAAVYPASVAARLAPMEAMRIE